MIKEVIKKEVKELLEDNFRDIIENLSACSDTFYQIHDIFYMENSLRFASAYVSCLFE